MIVELHINGKIAVELTPQNQIEQMVLDEMYQRANKGGSIEMHGGWEEREGTVDKDKYVIEVER